MTWAARLLDHLTRHDISCLHDPHTQCAQNSPRRSGTFQCVFLHLGCPEEAAGLRRRRARKPSLKLARSGLRGQVPCWPLEECPAEAAHDSQFHCFEEGLEVHRNWHYRLDPKDRPKFPWTPQFAEFAEPGRRDASRAWIFARLKCSSGRQHQPQSSFTPPVFIPVRSRCCPSAHPSPDPCASDPFCIVRESARPVFACVCPTSCPPNCSDLHLTAQLTHGPPLAECGGMGPAGTVQYVFHQSGRSIYYR